MLLDWRKFGRNMYLDCLFLFHLLLHFSRKTVIIGTICEDMSAGWYLKKCCWKHLYILAKCVRFSLLKRRKFGLKILCINTRTTRYRTWLIHVWLCETLSVKTPTKFDIQGMFKTSMLCKGVVYFLCKERRKFGVKILVIKWSVLFFFNYMAFISNKSTKLFLGNVVFNMK